MTQQPERKPILCLDFDGVLHSYTSGWKGIDVIPDPPVPGAREFLIQATAYFEVHIFSSRSASIEGVRAMQDYIGEKIMGGFVKEGVAGSSVWDTGIPRVVVRCLHFPTEKPPALVTIDDRAITFTGEWPSMETLRNFKPWNHELYWRSV